MKRAPERSGRRNGAALVTVVLLALALFAVGHGMIAVSLGELAASRAAVRHLEARTAAEAAVYEALGAPGWPWMDSLARGEARGAGTRTLGRAESSGVLRRLSAESWWVEGTGRVGVAESRTARLAWALDPLERVVSLDAAVSVGAGAPLVLTGTVDASSPAGVEPPLVAADCAPWAVALEAHYLSDPLSAVAVLPVADSLPILGIVGFPELLAGADVVVAGSGSPGPVEWLGACAASAPWNWGDPERAWRPCGSHLPLRGAYGPLQLSGGVGQAVLVVDGDLTLEGGARVFGLVITSGELRVQGGAELVGLAIAQGGVVVAADGRVRGSGCWAARALAAQRATLGRLRPVPGVGVIGPI